MLFFNRPIRFYSITYLKVNAWLKNDATFAATFSSFNVFFASFKRFHMISVSLHHILGRANVSLIVVQTINHVHTTNLCHTSFSFHLHFSIVKDDGNGQFLNELKIQNTLDPSPYLGLPLNGKKNSGVS